MDSRPTRSVRSRKTRRQVVDQPLDMENNNSSSSLYNNTLNDSRFDDTPTRLYDDVARKSSRTPSKINSFQSTPIKTESSEMDRKLSRSVRSRKSRQEEVDQTLDMENNSSLLNASSLNNNTLNNSRFDDTPTHLYGLDNPDEINSVKVEGRDSKTSNISQQDTPTNKKKTGGNSVVQYNYEELVAELKTFKEKVIEIEQELKMEKVPSDQSVFLDDKSFNGNGKELNKLLNSRITEALNRWDADKIGMPDYALESSGGQIHSAYHSPTFSNGAPQLMVFGIPLWYEVKTPRVVIQQGNSPGDCWAFQGHNGFVVIKLSQTIKPSSFTLEHMPASLSQFGDNSIPSAPKDFSVWGWSDAHGKERTKLGEYVYDNKATALQTFSVQVSSVPYFRFVELRVHSNYGNPSYTCLYRFRVHGVPYVQKYNQ
ncbi:unnamed protein product [Porites evermanni]|uniref:SUN domain-containing protein n=1 Tax=Porites evermanni TaxID=104178 RepID=A0ABN8SMG9_9CNID|nr:unnamed protein product [Porites evermanni]